MHSAARARRAWRFVMAAAALGLITLAFTPHTTLSKTTTWTNLAPSDDNWSNPSNWNNGIPSFFDVVLFDPVGGTSTQDIPALSLDLMDMTGYTGTLTLAQPLDVASDLVTAGTFQANGNTLNIGGSLTVDGYMDAMGAAVAVTGDVTLVGAYNADGGGTLTLDGSLQVGPMGALEVGDGTLMIGGDLDLGSAVSIWNSSSTLHFNGSGLQTWTAGSSSADYGTVEVASGSTVSLTAPATAVTVEDLVVGPGTLELDVGGLTVHGSTDVGPSCTLVNTSSTGATLQFDGDVTVDGTFSSTAGGCTLRFAAGLPGVTVGTGATFEASGLPGNRTRLEQDGVGGGPQWVLANAPGATLTFDEVEVQDSYAQPGPATATGASIDLGNNTNWFFPPKTTTWIGGGGSNDWSDSGNWDNGIPGDNDDVLFAAVGGLSTMDIPSLSLNSLDMTGYSGDLDVTQDLAVVTDVTLAGVVNANSRILTVGGNLVVDGDLDAGNGTLTVIGHLDVAGTFTGPNAAVLVGGNTTVSGTLDVSTGGNIDVTGDLDMTGSLLASGGTVTAGGSLTGTGGATLDLSGGGTLSLSGDLDVTGATATFSGGGTLRLTGSGTQTWSAGPTSSDYGSVQVTGGGGGGRVVLSATGLVTLDQDLDVGQGTLELGGGDLHVTGATTVSSGGSLENSTNAGATLQFDGGVSVTGATFSSTAGGCTLRFEAGLSGKVNVDNTGTFVVSGVLGNRTRLEQDGSLGGTQWILEHGVGATLGFDHVDVQDSQASPGPVTATNSGDLGNNTNWFFAPKTTIWTAGGVTDLWSEADNWNNGFPAIADTVLFDPVGGLSTMDIPVLTLASMDMTGFSGTLELGSSLAITGHVTTTGSFALSGHALDVGGDLTVGGSLDATSVNVTVGGSVHVASGSLIVGSGLLSLGGDLDVDPASSSLWDPAGGGTVRFDGSTVQTWSDQSSSPSYGHVDVEPAAYVVIAPSASPLTIGGNVSVGGAGGTVQVGTDLIVGGGVLVANGASVEAPAGPIHPVFEFQGLFDLLGTLSVTNEGSTLRFAAGPTGAFTVGPGATLELVGTLSNRIRLEQDGVAGGTQWIFDHDPTAALILDFLEVQDSDASAGPTVMSTHSIDLGNNLNWDYGPKATTWTGAAGTGLWSDALNWDFGVPAFRDTVLFDPVGGSSLMDIPGLTLESMDMSGFSGTLTLDTDLDIFGFVTVSGTFGLASHSVDVGGKLTVGGTLDASLATLSVGDSLRVLGGTLVAHGGLLDLYGPMDGTIGAVIDFDSLTTTRVRDDIDLTSFSYGLTLGRLESHGSSDREFRRGTASFSDLVIDHSSDTAKLTLKGSWVAVRNQFDGVEGDLELQVDSLTVMGDANLGLPAGPFLRVSGTGVKLDILGQTLSGNFSFEANHSVATLHEVDVTGAFLALGDGADLRIAPNDTITVQSGATMQVVGGVGALDRSKLRLDGTAGSGQWILDVRPGATTNFGNVEVQDSDASPGETCTATGDSHDLGNNDNWTFPLKTTTWVHGGITDNWSEFDNWDNGVPATGDTVLFDPIGGLSLMDIPLLSLESMDMTGYSGALTLSDSLVVGGFVTVSGTFALSGHSLDVGGKLTVGGTLDAASARVSIGDSLFVAGGTLVVHGGLLDLYGPMDGTSATLDFDSLSVMRVRATVDLTDFSGGYDMGGLESRGEFDREFHSAEVSWGDVVIDHASSDVKMTFIGGPVAVRNQFDGVEGDLELQVDSLTILGDANLGLPAGPFLRVSGTGVKLNLLGSTLSGNFSFEATHSVAKLHEVDVTGAFLALGDGADLRIAPNDTITVQSGATMQVVGGVGALDRSKLRLDGTAGSGQWLLDVRPGATTNFGNVEVQDSDASPGETCTATGDSHDLGNNDNWTFPLKTTTWIHGGVTDNWSELANWDNGVPAIGDTVLFDPIGGLSVMDVPLLTLESMDMTGYSGTLTLGDSLDISGFVTVSGTFGLSGHSVDVGGKLTVGGTLDVGSARLSVGDSLHVPGGTLVMHGGLLDLYGPMDGTIGAELECDSLSTMRMRSSVDLRVFAQVESWQRLRIEDYGSDDRSFRIEKSTFHSLGIDHSSSSAKLTMKGGPVAVRNEFDWVEGDLELQVDSLTILGDANLGLPAGPVVRLTGDGVTITLAGQTLSGNFSFEATHSVASFGDVDVTGAFLAVGDGSELRFGPGDSVLVESGAAMEVVGGSTTDRCKLHLDGTPLSDQWILDVRTGATTNFENIEVQDSDASPGQTCVATGECLDYGNNDNWQFVASAAGDTPPTRLTLRAAPNPFNPSTTIHYGVPGDGRVTIRIYDVRGALVRTVLSAVRKRGVYAEPWDGTDDARNSVGSGVYFCRIQAGGASETAKLVLLK